MPRRARLKVAGLPVHVVHRGNNRQDCFAVQYDFQHYLRLLEEASAEAGCRVHAYVLMTNHVHLLLTGASESSISATLKRTAEIYAMSFNRRYRRTGSVWEGRFHSSVVQSDSYLLNCYRYIEMNPVRAGIKGTPAAYPWSSYRANAFGARSFVCPHDVYVALGASSESRQKGYRSLFEAAEDPKTLRFIRETVQAGFALGDTAFCLELERVTGRRAQRRARGRKSNAGSVENGPSEDGTETI